jgi:glyoxylase-like metal-dependent hydrolase (beta-lactamase superfamily II)
MSADQRSVLRVGEYGVQVLPDLFVVSWLGMCAPQIDSHVYVLRGRSELLLIDCGTPWGHERLVRNMAHWGLTLADVRTILLTHGHVDHACGGFLFKQRGAEILGHREIAPTIEQQWEARGVMKENGGSYRMDGELADGDRIQRCGFDVRVIHTPGHTRGCVSYLIDVNGKRCLFSGDLLMSDGAPGWRGEPSYSEATITASLRRALEERFDHLCHGHDVIVNDRGQLFREGLEKQARGLWDTMRAEPIAGRGPAIKER